jgi:phosphoglycerate kinase
MGETMTRFQTLEDITVTNKVVLVRVDLNVPMNGRKVADTTRIVRLLPTINYLLKKKAKVVLLSHFGRPEGVPDPSMSLAALVDPLAAAIGKPVQFGVDCVGEVAEDAVKKLKPGEILLLENLRFHAGEEKGDAKFAKQLADLGDIFVNDAFAASHRAHASVTGIAKYLPAIAGKLMQEEIHELESLFFNAKKPIAAIIGGAKVSTKLKLLNNLVKTMDVLLIGGAMANTFLYAQGYKVGHSRCEKEMKKTARLILSNAKKRGCRIVLPVDLVVTYKFKTQAECEVVDVENIPAEAMAADVGPATVGRFAQELMLCKTVVWNGPVGAFETSPFDASSIGLARVVARLTANKKLRSVSGGGDTVAMLAHAGVTKQFSYISTAGGAFLEWLEGKTLPGVAALMVTEKKKKAAR